MTTAQKRALIEALEALIETDPAVAEDYLFYIFRILDAPVRPQ